MNLEHLRYFIEAARLSHLGRAAANLRITVSAVSHAIAQLEEALGVALFEKSGRGVVVTWAGQRLRERAEEILALVGATRSEIASPETTRREHLRVAATHGLLQRRLAAVLGAQAHASEGFTFEIYSRRSAEAVEAVVRGEVDAALVYSPQDSPRIEIEVLAREPLVIACAPGHPLVAGYGARRLPVSRLIPLPAAKEHAFFASLAATPLHASRAMPTERHVLRAFPVEDLPVSFQLLNEFQHPFDNRFPDGSWLCLFGENLKHVELQAEAANKLIDLAKVRLVRDRHEFILSPLS